ncbi:MAG TPA: SAM-dependent methyltransferase, partial [Acidimicrobiales bacterium]
AVLLVTTLNFVPDDSDPHAIVAQLVRAVAPGTHLVVAHPSFDISAEGMPEASARLSRTLNVPWVVRSRDEIARFFDGLDMVEPGLVPIDEWRPTGGNPPPPTGRRVTPIFGGVGRKS